MARLEVGPKANSRHRNFEDAGAECNVIHITSELLSENLRNHMGPSYTIGPAPGKHLIQ
ncbi:predicted protein [Coccidioides posadasii str. Silveira]|uniref:Predicted protein n=1 Tax=Coccidioides posadasii (strain RMSCC 757 / Silveira) TaxID=443226 RepID=E9D9W6_COCPS|nr:predicted protein [Coccidioides posadasii str. Silveira]